MSRASVSPAQRGLGKEMGRRLADHRALRKLSGAELSRSSGVSLDAIRSVESGRTPSPGFWLVVALTSALQVSLDDLARETQERTRAGDTG